MTDFQLSRRTFLKVGAFAGAAGVLASSLGNNLKSVQVASAAEQTGIVEKIQTMCRACLNNCGAIAHVQDGRVIKLEGDPADPQSNGALCAKGLSGIQALYNPCRMKYPMKRVGERGTNEWERISWEDAINTIADVLWEYYQKEGPKSLMCSTGGGGNPQFFSPHRFLGVWGGGNFFEPGCAQCYLPRNHTMPAMNGTADTSFADGTVTEPFMADHPTKCYVCWGTAPSYSGTGSIGQVMTHARAAGMKTVVIDPRMTPDAARADVWLPLRPATDVALALAWINYIVTEELYNKEFVLEWSNLPFLVNEETSITYRADELGIGEKSDYVVWDANTNSPQPMPYPFDPSLSPVLDGTFEVDGTTTKTAFRKLKEAVAEWSIEKAAETCWVEADKIEEAIKLYVEASPNAGISLGVATDQNRGAAQAPQAITILDILMGNIQSPGAIVQDRAPAVPCNYQVLPFGLFGPHPLSVPEEEVAARLGYIEHKGLGHWLASHIPTVVEAVKTGVPYRPKLWIERSGNKLAMVGDASGFAEAMKGLDFIVHMYMYPTSMSVEFADIILPTAEWLETSYAQDRCNVYGIRRSITQLYEAVDECMIWSWLAFAMAERGHERFAMSIDPEIAGKRYGAYWRNYDEYKDFVGYTIGHEYYGKDDWDWTTFDAQAPSEFMSMEQYQNDPYYRYQKIDDETGLPIGFKTTSRRTEAYFDGNVLLGRTGALDGSGQLPPASVDYKPLPYYEEPGESPLTDTEYPYVLTQGRLAMYHHGTLRNVPYTRELCPYPETWMHPDTAREIGVEDGDWLWLESRRGKTQGRTRVTLSVQPKVIYQERFWNPELLDSDDPSQSWKAFNVNMLTKCDPPFNPEYGTYTLRGFQIKITKADGPPPGAWIKAEEFTPWLPDASENTGGGDAIYGA
ncbi:MAG: molybdopterin-dependent oxidoreductase [Coriobacteriales bacterium]|nr:molybdopterin-dependent oxidoreductase [Coriobacteriales bacterium]